MVSAVVIVGVVLVQAASGAVWWLAANRRRSPSLTEVIGMGLALGTVASMLSAMVLSGTVLDSLAWALPAAITAVVLLVVRRRLPRPSSAPAELVAVALGLVGGLVLLLGNWARVPLDDPGTTSYTDLLFFEAISRGLAQFGPAQSILMAGGALRYHWFSYAWAGELAQTSNAASFVTITRALPIVTLVGVSMLVAAWAGSLSRVRWVPSLATLVVVLGGYTGALYGTVLNFDSPSQSMTTLWLLGLAIAFLALVDGRVPRVPGLALVAVLAVACTGGKISHAAVAAGGIALVTVVGLVTRARWRRRALAGGLVAAVAMTVTYLWVLAGVAVDQNLTEQIAVKASTWQGLDPLVGRGGVILGTCALVLAILARLAGIGWLVALRRWRLEPSVAFVVGAVGVGLAAMLLLREGVNELWFVLAASAPAGVVSAVGVGVAMRGLARQPRPLGRPLAWAVAVAVPASVAALVLSANWGGAQQVVLNWLAPLSAWALVMGAALAVALGKRPQGRVVVPALALAVGALVLTSIGTRPAALWTSSRPITTERGEVAPESGLPGEAAGSGAPSAAVSWDNRAAAAAWLSENTDERDIVATSDPLSAVVPALSGRQMYLAGDIYQVGLGRADELDDVHTRSAISVSLADGMSAEALADLCAAGVDYLWIERDEPATGVPVAWAGDGITILRLPPERCPA